MPITPIRLSQFAGLRSGSASRREVAQPAERVLLLAGDGVEPAAPCCRRRSTSTFLLQVGLPGGHLVDRPADGERQPAPGEHDHGHHRGGDHDLQRLAARLVDAEQVLAQEVERDGAGDGHRAPAS